LLKKRVFSARSCATLLDEFLLAHVYHPASRHQQKKPWKISRA